MVGGDPAVLNDCGNQLMTASTAVGVGGTKAAPDTFDRATLGRAAPGTSMDAAYSAVVAAVARAVENLQGTLAEDGSLLQRASRDIDTVFNTCDTTPGRRGGRNTPSPT